MFILMYATYLIKYPEWPCNEKLDVDDYNITGKRQKYIWRKGLSSFQLWGTEAPQKKLIQGTYGAANENFSKWDIEVIN